MRAIQKEESILNFTIKAFFSVVVRGSSFVVMRVPEDRALGGMRTRKRRTEWAFGEKGLILAATSVMNFICMFAVVWVRFVKQERGRWVRKGRELWVVCFEQVSRRGLGAMGRSVGVGEG